MNTLRQGIRKTAFLDSYMGVKRAAAFDAELRELLMRRKREGDFEFAVQTTVKWGMPLGRF